MFMKNEYAFLSNFYPCEVAYKGLTYESSEAAFQAQKERLDKDKIKYTNIPPNVAKRMGRQALLPSDWEQSKDRIMYEVVLAKFSQNPDFKKMLLNVKEEIVEDNTWNDTYWGCCNGIGLNKLGKILTKVREELQHE